MELTRYKATLDKSSKKFPCPSCGEKRLVKYVDASGNYIRNDVGRCDREIECGYHLPPREADGIELADRLYSKTEPIEPPKPSTLPFQYVERSQGKYEANTFISWLASLPGWDKKRAEAVANLYKVGTGLKDVEGWAIFWQIDKQQNVRSGKLMKYDASGHRVKDGYSQDWIHSKLKRIGKLQEFELVQCFYGLHLVGDKPIAIVESEKTAIIASQYLPAFTWLASGQLQGISEYKMQDLKGKQVVLFPDIGAYDLWSEKASELQHITDIKVSSLLERKASEEDQGYDLADYLIQFDLQDFLQDGSSVKLNEKGYPASWDNVKLEKEDPEFMEAHRQALNDADEFERLQLQDEIFSEIVNIFDAVPTNQESL